MLNDGVIEYSNSPYCNPLRIALRKNDDVRICLDARFINETIESDNESPPLISELMQKFYGVTYMSTTDLANGYWQIPLHKESRIYTAFLYGSRMYQFCRIPFGIKMAGSAFMRALGLALEHQFNDVLTMCVDDMLIASSGSIYDHLEKIHEIFRTLQDQNFTLKLEKSFFCRQSVRYLGYELSTEGIHPPQDQLDVIRKYPIPENATQLQQFLGICT